jgi:hypothetical protein
VIILLYFLITNLRPDDRQEKAVRVDGQEVTNKGDLVILRQGQSADGDAIRTSRFTRIAAEGAGKGIQESQRSCSDGVAEGRVSRSDQLGHGICCDHDSPLVDGQISTGEGQGVVTAQTQRVLFDCIRRAGDRGLLSR